MSLPKNNYISADYFCKATLTKGNTVKSVESDTISVNQAIDSGIPTVFLNTENRVELINKTDKVNSTVVIIDENGNELLNDSYNKPKKWTNNS